MSLKQCNIRITQSHTHFELSRQVNVMYMTYMDVIIQNVETLSSYSSSTCRFGSNLVAKL